MRVSVLALFAVGCATTASVGVATKRPLTLPTTSAAPRAQAVHVLNRLAWGPSPTDLDTIERVGLSAWLEAQLEPGVDPAIDERLSGFKTLPLSVADAFRQYPRPQAALKAMGVDVKTEAGKEAAKDYARLNADELPRQLLVELTQAKLLRAANSKRQFEEVLVDFWFNHFNVSAEKGRVRWMVNAYEREAIRPHVYGRFRDLLGATAKHPAMLWYLDGWLSVREGFSLKLGAKKKLAAPVMEEDDDGDDPPEPLGTGRALGLNENYARELLELHTVGVNAGYTQDDVREAAKALTGWSLEVRPRQPRFGQFVFRPQAHDDGARRVFGLELPSGLGQQHGEQLLDFLARHPATARHLALKLCQRLVSDTPPQALVERVAAVFLSTDGDLPSTYRAIVESPEFWSPEAMASKTRTPLEFVVGAVRAVGTLDEAQRPLATALEQMGQPLYRCAPPTGYREDTAAWVSAGGLVARINFGLKLAAGRIPGVVVALPPKETPLEGLAQAILGGPASEATLATIRKALAVDDEVDERRDERPKVVGLLLGSPEFQRQ
jgi:uncharacterized protein (DUF1800 family)